VYFATGEALPGFVGSPVFNVPFSIDFGQTTPQITSVAVTWQIAGLAGDVTPVGYGPDYTPADADRGLMLSAILTPFSGTTAGPAMTIPGMIVQ
jgi:hypothetical protein